MGVICRWTYFLRANGLTLPQKPWRVSFVLEVCDELSGVVEAAGCWASAGSESRTATNNATTARFFIFYILRWGSFLVGSQPHALRGRDRDLVRPSIQMKQATKWCKPLGALPASGDASHSRSPKSFGA